MVIQATQSLQMTDTIKDRECLAALRPLAHLLTERGSDIPEEEVVDILLSILPVQHDT